MFDRTSRRGSSSLFPRRRRRRDRRIRIIGAYGGHRQPLERWHGLVREEGKERECVMDEGNAEDNVRSGILGRLGVPFSDTEACY